MLSHPVTLGIIGAGHVVKANHLPVLKAMPQIAVSWITDKDLARAQRIGKSYDVPVRDLSADLLSFPKTDVVLLAIPFGVRAPYYEALSQLPSAIFVEKPIARTVAGHRKLCDTFGDSRIACGFNRRAWGIVQLCKKVVTSGLFGKVRRVRFGMGTLGGIPTASHYMADAKLAGGGMLIETGVHGVDTVLYCLDAQRVQLEDGNMIMENGHDIHCNGLFTVVTSRGEKVPFEIEVSRLKNTVNRIEFHFDHCNVIFTIFDSLQLWVTSKDGAFQSLLSTTANCYPFRWTQVLMEFWRDFLDGVKNGQANYTSAGDSVLTTQVIQNMYDTAEAGWREIA
jgi:predicted dehydrogenase